MPAFRFNPIKRSDEKIYGGSETANAMMEDST
jgi:hypothetical protein